jgi:cell division protein FtsI/penicillin-binding protein 2
VTVMGSDMGTAGLPATRAGRRVRPVRRARRTTAAALALAVLGPTLSACFEEPSAHEAVREFLVGWQSGDYLTAARRTDGDPQVVARAIRDVGLQLDAASFRFKIKSITREDDTSTAAFEAEIDLGENNPLWVYDSTLPLHLVDGSWKVRWSPSVLHPELHEGQRFAVDPTLTGRQPVLDRAGDPLQEDAELYVAGVTPARLKDPAKVCEQLAKVTGFAQDRLLSKILSAPPTTVVPLVTFGRTKYAQLRDRLAAIPDLVIDTQRQPVAPAPPKQIVGRVSAVTPEDEQRLGGAQRAGDSVGLGGLQKAYQEQLTGSMGTRVITLDARSGEEVAEIKEWPGRSNSSVRTTIDSRIQNAAEVAVAGTNPVALVAVDATTGEVRAVGTSEMHQEKDALAGKFPAGTAFSVVAADALLKSGLDPKQKLACPARRSVAGVEFQQVGGPVGEAPSFQANFASGCVTGLAALARVVDANELAAGAAAFGIGSPWRLPLNSFSGSMPALPDDAAKAKAIAGLNVRVSPLAMALVAGAVASGTWRPPTLVTQPTTLGSETDGEAAPPPQAVRLDEKSVRALRTLMRAGVTSGTAGAASLPGERVYGIASAPFATDKHKRLQWFVGWHGEVAVAVLAADADPAAIAGNFFRGIQNPA